MYTRIESDSYHQLSSDEFQSLSVNLKLVPLKERFTLIANQDRFPQTIPRYIIPRKQDRESQTFSNFKSSLSFPPSYSEWRRMKQRNIQIVLLTSQLLTSNPLLYERFTEMLTQLSQVCRAFFYGCEVSIVTDMPIESTEARIRLHPQTNRIQYLAFDIIKYLEKKRPKNVFSLIGVTVEDLFPDYLANFVLGHANFKGGSGVISLGKYADENGGVMRVSQSRLLWRLTKVLLHELTHTFGIAHCYDLSCLMNPSGSIPEAECQTLFLCPYCLVKLSHVLKFEMVERFHTLESALFQMKRYSTELNTIWREQSYHFNLYHLGVGSPCVDKENCEIQLQRMDEFAKEKWESSLIRITELNKVLF